MGKALVSTVLFFLFYTHAAAIASDYRCRIERLSQAGAVSDKVRLYREKQYIGQEFTVERRTGIMAGALKNAYVTQPQIIDYGSTDNSFKVVTTMRLKQGVGRGSTVYALTVREFDESPKKPFVFLADDEVYFGSCEHF